MGWGVVTEWIHDWILLETSFQQDNYKYFFFLRSWTMIVVNPWSHLCQVVSLERHCKFTSDLYVPVKSFKWRKSRLVLSSFIAFSGHSTCDDCKKKNRPLTWLLASEQWNSMIGLPAPWLWLAFPPFHLNFYLKVAWNILNKCLNYLAQISLPSWTHKWNALFLHIQHI